MQVRTYREGVAQKVGHDLIIDVELWHATVELAADGSPTAIVLDSDARSLALREGLNGLSGQPIAFRSTAIERDDGRLTVRGDLTLAGTTRPATFELVLSADGRLRGTLPVTQSEWGISP